MPLVSMNVILPRAKANKFAAGEFNMNNLEFARASVVAATEENSPFVYGVSEDASNDMGIAFNDVIPARHAMKAVIQERIRLFGSNNQA